MPLLDTLLQATATTPVCPRCKRPIPSEDVNVATDVAFCRACDITHRLSALATGSVVDENVDLSRPPGGAWFERTGDGVVLGATHRALGQAFGLLFFSLFWNGVVSVFVLMATAATLHHLGIPLPHWFPMSKGTAVPLPLTIFLWLFLTPFIAVGLVVLATFLSALAGRTELRIQRDEVTLFTGVGPVGFRKRFATTAVRDVRLQEQSWRDNRGTARQQKSLVIDTDAKPVTFGTMLSEPRRRFIAAAAKKELVRS